MGCSASSEEPAVMLESIARSSSPVQLWDWVVASQVMEIWRSAAPGGGGEGGDPS